jgi:hypothetical protein
MAGLRRYGEELRAIGQALEAKGVSSFELYNVEAGYFVRDLGEHRQSLHLRNWLAGRRVSASVSTYGFELGEVEELSKSGRARRSKAGQLPLFRGLPNILRTIGAYLDSREAELMELHKRPISVSLAYRDKSGHEYREDRPLSTFHSFFRELFAKRK